MKKVLTLILSVFAIFSMNAQEKYVAIERNAETGAMTLSEEFKAVLPLNEDGTYGDVATNKDSRGSVVVMKTASVTVEAVGGSTPADVPDVPGDNTMTHVDINADGTVNSWNDIKWQQKNQGDINWAWIQGTGYPAAKIEAEVVMTDDVPATYVDADGVVHKKYRPKYTSYNPDGSLGVPEMGLYYKVTATTAGTIKIGTWVNKGSRKTYVVDAATALPVAYEAEGYINGQNETYIKEDGTEASRKKYLTAEEIDSIHKANCTDATTGEDTKPYVIGAGNQPFFGYITFMMEAGKTYYVFCESPQLGFNGWEFTPAPAAGPEIPANAIYYWESPDGTPVEEGGKIEYMNGDGERLNYSNAGYHTICLNGKKGNMNDAPSANSGYMLLTLDEALQAGDIINITAYRNKNADGKNATIQFYFENGAEWADSKSFVNICADENDEDYDDDGATPNTHTWEITATEAGSKTIKLIRNSAATNLFITKLEIIRPSYEVSHVTLDKSETTIEVGQSVTLTATVFPEKPNDVTVSWTTSDANVATVDNGVVKAVGVGTTTITAQVGSKTATCEVTVYEIPVTSVTLDKSETAIEAGKSFTLTATVLPDSATFKNVIWSTSNSSVAIVDNGVVKAVGVGTATIKAIAGDKTAECVVTVEPDYVTVNTTAKSTTAGLLDELAIADLKNITALRVMGTINSYDIIVLNNKMPNLHYLDLTDARIVACDYEYRSDYRTEDDVVGNYMFSGQAKYYTIKLPKTTKAIGYYAFGSCSNLTDVDIPSGVTSIGNDAFSMCYNLTSVTIPNGITTIESWLFYSCNSLQEINIPSSVRSIGVQAFSFTGLREITIPSSVRRIGDRAFESCSNLNKIYTRTIEPIDIGQGTFSSDAYSNATLYVPKTSYNLYWMNTEWSQFANLVEYDAPYDSFYVSNDYILDDETGNVQGTPDVDLDPGSGLVHEGSSDQNLGDVHVNANDDVSASIIGNGNLNIENLYLDITVNANRWYFFSFPYKIMLDKILHPGEYIWSRYDGNKRATNGHGGWTDVTTDCLNQGEGYIYQTSKNGLLSVQVLKEQFGKMEADDINLELNAYVSNSANNASWNLLGNPFASYYDISDMGYDAPVTIWNGNNYEAMRPGDDDYILRPFEAFFVQKANETNEICFKAGKRMTYNQSKDKKKKVAMKSPAESKRFVINLTISDGSNNDKTRVVFNDNQQMDYEIGCDAAKFMSTEAVPQLYTVDNRGVKYSINERPEGEVAMGYVASREGEYTISAVRMDKAVLLKDLERGVIHDLSTGDYTFASEAGTFEGRFVLMVNAEATDINGIKAQTGVEIAVVDGGISISGAAGKTVNIYNVGGQLVAANVTDGVVALAGGTYIVTVDGVSTKVVLY